MKYDPFSRCHPLVNLVFFLGAICLTALVGHPAYLALGFGCSLCYYLQLYGRRGVPLLLGLVPMYLVLTLVNPLLNPRGSRVLFAVFGRPYTLEALAYGASISAVLVIMVLWMGCWNRVMTGDKFTGLFGKLIPALSLVLVMVMGLVPSLIRKAGQITGSRSSIGIGTGGTRRERLFGGLAVLSALTSWALESSLVTADSMRSRGYGTGKSTSFRQFRMERRDRILLLLLVLLLSLIAAGMLRGHMAASYLPAEFASIHPLTLGAYGAFLLLPSILSWKEDILWFILKSGI